MSEMIDIYDPNIKWVGTKSRKQAHLDGDWHKAFHCWIVAKSENGPLMIVQRRGPDKSLFPNALDISAAGHYEAGEDIRGGIREIKEELGIDIDPGQLVSLGVKFDVAKVGDIVNYELDDVYLVELSSRLRDYNFDPEEVSGLALFGIEEGLDLFSGRRESITAKTLMAVRSNDGTISLEEEEVLIGTSDFIPRTDPYVYKVLILAKRYFAGEEHLVI